MSLSLTQDLLFFFVAAQVTPKERQMAKETVFGLVCEWERTNLAECQKLLVPGCVLVLIIATKPFNSWLCPRHYATRVVIATKPVNSWLCPGH